MWDSVRVYTKRLWEPHSCLMVELHCSIHWLPLSLTPPLKVGGGSLNMLDTTSGRADLLVLGGASAIQLLVCVCILYCKVWHIGAPSRISTHYNLYKRMLSTWIYTRFISTCAYSWQDFSHLASVKTSEKLMASVADSDRADPVLQTTIGGSQLP